MTIAGWSFDDIVAAFSLIAAAILGVKYTQAAGRNASLSIRIGQLELNEKLRKNKEEADKHFAGRSDSDVLSESIAGPDKVPKQ
jgi:hypothetical protein